VKERPSVRTAVLPRATLVEERVGKEEAIVVRAAVRHGRVERGVGRGHVAERAPQSTDQRPDRSDRTVGSPRRPPLGQRVERGEQEGRLVSIAEFGGDDRERPQVGQQLRVAIMRATPGKVPRSQSAGLRATLTLAERDDEQGARRA